mmetsp:Transcript_34709/g.79169  ORF Transcript_34709/g.79169 Transcript_34709/m.79169 type:complete len:521 (-) Transcript_34709:40-1602(-)
MHLDLGLLFLACFCVAAHAAQLQQPRQPNIVVVLTDDQDILLGGISSQSFLKQKVIDQGMRFEHGFANTPVCCPSRSSILTGKFTHNHGARNNSKEGGCASDSWYAGPEKDSLAVHMHQAGYYSLYAGKYLNNYGLGGRSIDTHIPPGWSEWFGLHGNSRYYNYTIQDNHQATQHGDVYKDDYLTDVLARRSYEFLEHALARRKSTGQPFFLMVGTPSAHAGFTPAPQYEDTAAGAIAPRPESWNKVFSDKHQTVRELKEMNQTEIEQSDRAFRQRLGTLRSVDDLIKGVFDRLEAAQQEAETYFFYTSDHGFHLGQFAMGFDKRQLYETDIRVPYFVRGPGVASNSSSEAPVSHVDLAPTIVDLATGTVPENWDGHSYKSVLLGEAGWRNDTLIQYFGEGTVESCGSGYTTYTDGVALHTGDYIPAPCDGANNTYSCLRRVAPDLSTDDIFCTFTCVDAGRNPVPCPADQAEGYGEYYDMTKDPWQVRNIARELPEEKTKLLKQRLAQLQWCEGQAGCM